jgi:hypothetical protein
MLCSGWQTVSNEDSHRAGLVFPKAKNPVVYQCAALSKLCEYPNLPVGDVSFQPKSKTARDVSGNAPTSRDYVKPSINTQLQLGVAAARAHPPAAL